MPLYENRADLAAKIAVEVEPFGWRVTTDPRNVNPPVVVVGAPYQLRRVPCGWLGQVDVSLVVAGPGNDDVLAAVLPILELVGPLVDVPEGDTAGPTVYYPDPSGDNGLPAYAFPATISS